MVAVWALIVTGGVLLIRFSLRQGRGRWHEESALEIVKRRYARGEIGKEAYEEIRNDLS
jgi:putative membrane protein